MTDCPKPATPRRVRNSSIRGERALDKRHAQAATALQHVGTRIGLSSRRRLEPEAIGPGAEAEWWTGAGGGWMGGITRKPSRIENYVSGAEEVCDGGHSAPRRRMLLNAVNISSAARLELKSCSNSIVRS
jgi:hypothetical protein